MATSSQPVGLTPYEKEKILKVVEPKIKTCLRILESVVRNVEAHGGPGREWTYFDLNVFIIVLEALAFQDDKLEVPGRIKNRTEALCSLGEEKLGKEEYACVRSLRKKLFHGDSVYLLRSCQEPKGSSFEELMSKEENPSPFFSKLEKYIKAVVNSESGVTFFTICFGPLTEDGTKTGNFSEDLARHLKHILPGVVEDGRWDVEKNAVEKAFYYFTVVIYSLISKYTNESSKIDLLRRLRSKRAMYIHKFYENFPEVEGGQIDMTIRQYSMILFLREAKDNIFKLLVATRLKNTMDRVKISKPNNYNSGLVPSTLEAFEKTCDNLRDEYYNQPKQSVPHRDADPTIDNEVLRSLTEEYFCLLPPIDDREASKARLNTQKLLKVLTGVERNFIRTEFQRFHQGSCDQDSLWKEMEMLGISREQFERMLVLYKSDRREHQGAIQETYGKLLKIKTDFYIHHSSLSKFIKAVPQNRVLSVPFGMYTLDNLEAKIFSMVYPPNNMFKTFEEYTADVEILYYLRELFTCSKSYNPIPRLSECINFSPFSAYAFLELNGNFDSKQFNECLQTVVRNLIKFKSPLAITCLRLLALQLWGKLKNVAPNLIFNSLGDAITIQDQQTNKYRDIDLFSMIYVDREKEVPSKADVISTRMDFRGAQVSLKNDICVTCVLDMLEYFYKEMPRREQYERVVSVILNAVERVALRWYQYEECSVVDKSIQLIENVRATKAFSELYNQNKSICRRTILMQATIQGKIDIRKNEEYNKGKVYRQTLAEEACQILSAETPDIWSLLQYKCDIAFHKSQLEENYEASLLAYLDLADCVLEKFEIQIKNFNKPSYKKLLADEFYIQMTTSNRHLDVLLIYRDIALQLYNVGKRASDLNMKTFYIRWSIDVYMTVIVIGGNQTRFLNPCAKTCIQFLNTCKARLCPHQIVSVLRAATKCYELAFQMAKRFYQPSHGACTAAERQFEIAKHRLINYKLDHPRMYECHPFGEAPQCELISNMDMPIVTKLNQLPNLARKLYDSWGFPNSDHYWH